MRRAALLIATGALSVLLTGVEAGAGAGPTVLEALRAVPVQDGGRVKPLDTFARESARRITGARAFGAESVGGLDPVEWVVAAMADPEKWKDAPIVRVGHAGLRETTGLPAGRDRYSFRELASHEPFLKAADAVRSRQEQDGDARLDATESETANLYGNLVLLSEIFSAEAVRIVPATDDASGTWASWGHVAHSDDPATRNTSRYAAAVLSSYAAGDTQGVAVAATALRARLAAIAPEAWSPATIDREVHYNRLKPFRLSWALYLVAFLVLLASFPLRSPVAGAIGLVVVAAAFAVQTYGMTLRTLVAGRAPVTNMYETVVFVSWGATLFALLFEAAYRARYFAACASGLGVLFLILADNVPILDGAIEPLVPVLRDNMWLTVHVLTIMLGYAAFFLGVALGHVNLGLYFFVPGRRALLRTMSQFLYRSLQAGTLFLAAGTLLGGVWASYSWGRFWGWDPKETWALIALLTYLAVLHGRFLGWIRDFGLAVGALVGGLTVLMAWYGVNFILGTGLHSYGFGTGGYAYVGGFVAFEVLVIVAAYWASRRARPAPLGGPALAGAVR
ncbi:MAG TPA: cytochrome c biogenesis protein CcsA [Vicinamibacteria bacterium]|nr:cytochrome c biogenesis protein CcsA [Vicinamibacteria bacterium]